MSEPKRSHFILDESIQDGSEAQPIILISDESESDGEPHIPSGQRDDADEHSPRHDRETEEPRLSSRNPMRRDWCFTGNRPWGGVPQEQSIYDAWIGDLTDKLKSIGCVRYAIVQLERGESGQVHAQGFIRLTKNVRMKWMANMLADKCFDGKKPHVEARLGTPKQVQMCMEWARERQWSRRRMLVPICEFWDL